MPRGDKSAYTDKQKRKAEHIEEGYEQRAFQKRKQSVALGQPSTRNQEAARKAAQVAGKRRATLPLGRADGWVAKPRQVVRRRHVPDQRRKPRQLGNVALANLPARMRHPVHHH